MVARMTRAAIFLLVLASASAPASAASNFLLINGTDGSIGGMSIRRAGSNDWKPLGPSPSAGARRQITFDDPECAFDLRAEIPGSGQITWSRVNLCDVKSVTLKRDSAAGPWVDYDAP